MRPAPLALTAPLTPSFINRFGSDLARLFARGGIAVIPTDTLYGICASALRPAAVRRVYKLRRRNPKKPMIVLIGSLADLKRFGVAIDPAGRRIVKKLWPGPVSVIFPVRSKKFAYLDRGTKHIAFRLPKPPMLRKLLRMTGPLVAPSANWEGKPPAATIAEAKRYFAARVNCYVDGGRMQGKPSTLVSIEDGRVNVLRKGAAKIRRMI